MIRFSGDCKGTNDVTLLSDIICFKVKPANAFIYLYDRAFLMLKCSSAMCVK